jgi:CheY-like chemotaxis protein
MKKNYPFLIIIGLFLLTLIYFSIWWIILGLFVGLLWIAYRFHFNRISNIEASKAGLESELAEKAEQVEKGVRHEKILRRKIEEIQKSKTSVLNKISHEIRTPMNGMIGMASLLGQTSLNPEQQDYLETIRNCGRDLITTINDILIKDVLNFSVGENSKTVLEQIDFNIRNCIDEVLDFFSERAEKAGIELLYKVAYDVPEQVMGDESRIRQILLNLMENAIINTTRGEIFIEVTLKEPVKKGEIDLAFKIKDTGSGMRADKLNTIITSLSNSDALSTIHPEDGGLGLIISDRLVKMMGGELLIISKVSEGTTVLFNIVTGHTIIPQRGIPLDNFVGLEGKRILLVVNNSFNADILTSHLGHMKLCPVSAKSGKQAMEVLSAEPRFDLLLIDLKLPDTDGIRLTQRILQQYPGLPVILMNCPNDEHYQQYPGLFKSILQRPIRQNMLHSQVSAGLISLDQAAVKGQNGNFLLSDKFSEKYPLHILIAEDNLINQQLAVKILNRLGYKPEVASNGEEVLEIVSLDKFDLILMDVEMTGMDGLEATRMIRLCLESQPIIVAMTANAMQGDREICLQSGMDDYLSKPVALEDLVRILEKWALTIKDKL